MQKYGAEALIEEGLISAKSKLLGPKQTIKKNNLIKLKDRIMNSTLDKEKAADFVQTELHVAANAKETTKSIVLNKALMDEAVQRGVLSKEKAASILDSYGIIEADKAEAASKKSLAQATLYQTKTLLTYVAVIGTTVIAYNLIRKATHIDTYEKLSNKIEELSNQYSKNQQHLNKLNSQLEENYKRMQEIASLNNPTYVEENELQKLKEVNQYLEQNKSSLEKAQQNIKDEKNDALYQKYYGEYLTNDAKEADVMNKSGNPLNWFKKDFQEDFTEVTGWKWKNPITTIKNEMDNQDGIFGKIGGAVKGIGKVQKQFRGIDTLSNVVTDFFDDFSLDSSLPELFAQRLGFEQVNPSVLTPDMQTAETIKEIENLRSAKSGSFTQDDEYAQQLEEKMEELKTTRAELSNSLMEAYETDPNFESPVSQMLLEQISEIDKAINPEQWEKDTFDNIFTSNNNEYEIRELKNKFRDSFETITYEDLIGENVTSQLAKALYGDASDESLKKAASLLFARLRTTFDKQSNNISSLLSFDEAFQSPDFKEAKDKLLELATSGELSAETISSTEEYKKLIDQTGISAEKLAEKIKEFNIDEKSSNIEYLKGILSDMEAGKTLDISQVSELISDNESLAGSVKKIGNSYKIEEDALKSLINSNIEQYNIAVSNQNKETDVAIEETEKRIKVYEAEIKAYYEKNKLYGHSSPTGYSGGTFTTDEQKAQGLWQTKANLEKEKKALDELKKSRNDLNLENQVELKDKKTNSSSQMNFIEILLDKVSKATEKIQKSFEDAFSLKSAKQNLTKALSQIQKEIQTNASSYARYMTKANNIGLSTNYITQIQNGSLNIEDFDSDSEVYDKIQSYQQWYEKAQACKDTIDSLHESEEQLKESYVDKITEYYDRKTKTYQNKIDSTNGLISMNEDIYGYSSSSLYNKAMKNTSKSISVYRKELSTLQKEQKNVNKNTNPSLWYKYQDAIDETKTSVSDLADSYLSLAKSKAEASITKRDAKVETLNNTKNLNDSKIDNAIGYAKKNAIVKNNISTENSILAKYKAAKTESTNVFKAEKKEASSKSFKKTLAKSGISKALIEKANNAVKQGKQIPAKVLNALKKNMSGNKNAENAYKQFLEYNTALDIKDTASSDYAKQKQESKSNIKQSQQQLLDNISQDFDLRIKAIQDNQSLLDAQNEITNAKGFDSSINYYKNSIKNIQDESKLLRQEREKLKEQLNANQWNKNSEEYKNALSSLNDIDIQLKNNEKSQLEWNNAILQIPIDKLSNYLDLLESMKSSNQSMMEYYKSLRGYSIEADFKEQIADNENEIKANTQLRNIYQEYAARSKEQGEFGGKTYQQWMMEINNIDNSIFGLKTANEELKDSLREEVYLKPYENLISTSDNIIKNFENMESLLSTFDFTLYDNKGNLNEYGLAKLGNFVNQLDENKNKIAAISDEIKKVEKLKKNGEINEIEYLEKINELQPEYNSTLLESANLIKSITDLMKEQAQQQINAMKEQIEAYKKLLSTEKEEHNYQKSMKEKTDNISSLQKRLLALGNGNTEETQAEYQKVFNELENAKDDLEETEWEHYIDLQIQALDDLSESLDDYLNNIDVTLESILETLNNAKGIVADVDSSVLLNKLLEGIGGNSGIFNGTSVGQQKDTFVSKLDLIRWANNYSGGNETSDIKNALSNNDMNGLMHLYNQYENKNANTISEGSNDDIRNYVAKILDDIVNHAGNVTAGKGYQITSAVENTTLSEDKAAKNIQEILRSMIYYSNTHGVPDSQVKQFVGEILPWLKIAGLNVSLNSLPGFAHGGIVEQVKRNGDDGIVSLRAGEAVLTESEITLFKKIDFVYPMIPSLINELSHLSNSIASTHSMQENSIENVNINLECPAVTKEELYSWLQDTRTQKIIQSSVIDPIMGNGTFGRYQH